MQWFRSGLRLVGVIGLWLCIGSGAERAQASELYASGNLFISGVNGSAGGSTAFFDITGSDSDSAPVFGGAVGFEASIAELFSRIGEWRVRDWRLRAELEALGGHDYQLQHMGGDGFFTNVSSWTVMNNYAFEVPIRPAVAWALGRVPLLEPVSFYTSVGIGIGGNDVMATDNVSIARDNSVNFVWQVGMGFTYDFTDVVSFGFGYRYQDLGSVRTDLLQPPAVDPVGDFTLGLGAHQFSTALRVAFWSLTLPRFER